MAHTSSCDATFGGKSTVNSVRRRNGEVLDSKRLVMELRMGKKMTESITWGFSGLRLAMVALIFYSFNLDPAYALRTARTHLDVIAFFVALLVWEFWARWSCLTLTPQGGGLWQTRRRGKALFTFRVRDIEHPNFRANI